MTANRGNLKGVCLLVTNIDAPSGGVQRNSRLLLKNLQERGINTYACVRNYHGKSRNEVIDGTVIHRSPVAAAGLLINGIIYFADTVLWLIRNRNRYDIIHCQQMFGPTMAAAVVSYIIRKPILTRVTAMGELGEVQQIRELPFARLRAKLIKRVSRWVALTEKMKQELISFGIPSDKIAIIYNSTDIPAPANHAPQGKADLRKELGLEGVKTAVFVGRLSAEKNLDVLLHAWVAVCDVFPQAVLLLLGEGGAYRNVEPRLRELVVELRIDESVRFLGHVSRVKHFVFAADVFVLPSRTEGMSNALVEAFSCGAAIVATDIPGNAELCIDRVNSLLVPVGDSTALACAVIKIFGSSELAGVLGAAARNMAEEKLTVDNMVSKYLEAYRVAIALTHQ